MVARQANARAEARQRRALANREAQKRKLAARERVVYVVKQSRMILADQTFVRVLRDNGIPTLPRHLVAGSHIESRDANFEQYSLDFVIAWSFMYPMLANHVIARQLDATWPGFTSELRDAFISLIAEGAISQSSAKVELSQ